MLLRVQVSIGIMSLLGLVTLASTASAGPCAGSNCTLGGAIRMQIGAEVPLPISLMPARTGFLQFGQEGLILPTAFATIMQTGGGGGPRNLTLSPGAFHHDGPQGSTGIVNFNAAVFAVQTNLTYDNPHPGTTKMGGAAFTAAGAAIPTPAANVFSAGGRIGAITVSYYANATSQGPGSPTNNYAAAGPVTPISGEQGVPPINGVARFTATANQFGGQSIGRIMGTAKVFYNGVGLDPALDLPCKVTATAMMGTSKQTLLGNNVFVPFVTGPQCQFSISIPDFTASDATVDVVGGQFGGSRSRLTYMTATGVFTGSIGYRGTILGTGAPVTVLGSGIPFTGQPANTVGFPLTTGMLTITVTAVGAGNLTEMFLRTGIDNRTAAGEGVVTMVTGSLSTRALNHPGATRGYVTLLVPELGSTIAASIGLLVVFGGHTLSRRRSHPANRARD